MLLLFGVAQTATAEVLPLERKLPIGAAMLWVAAAFALFPDVDTKSRGQMLFYWLVLLLDLVLLYLGRFPEAAALGVLALIPILSRHRGWTHSPVAMILVPLPIVALPMYFHRADPWIGLPYYLAAVAGYLSHLLLDGTLFRRRR